MKNITLQVRITAITGVILLVACLLLTVNSLFAAHTYYGDYAALIESGQVMADPAQGEMEIDSALLEAGGEYQAATQKFSVQSVLVMALIVALALGATYWATGRMLRPLKKLTQSVRTVDDQHLNERVSLSDAQGEVFTLTESFNHMLDRLEESFSIQKRFAANAAHELKTPLAIMKSSLQVLEMDPTPQITDYQEFMQDANQSLDRIITTVEGLLSLSNLDAAILDGVVELRPLLEQAVQELSAKAKACDVTLTIRQTTSVAVRGNPSLLYRAFYNLMENAIKYNRPGGIVSIFLKQEEGAARIQVADTGMGMSPETLPHIFEPFYRADPSRSQQIPGSGLGLAVVKLIVDRHDGMLQVESEAGAGSVFTVTLQQAKKL